MDFEEYLRAADNAEAAGDTAAATRLRNYVTQKQNDAKLLSSLYAPPAPKPEEVGGFMASAKQSLGAVVKGAGQAAGDYLPGVDDDNAVKRYGQSIIAANPTAVHGFEDIANNPLTAAKEAVGNAGSSMGAMVGARALGTGITALSPLTGPAAPAVALLGQAVSWLGPAAIAALPSYGGIREKQVLNDPENNEDWKSKAIATLGAATVGAIETKFGPQNWALGAMTKEGRAALAAKFAETTLAKAIGYGTLKGGAIEGAEELVQNPVEQLASYDNPLTKKNLQETAFSGAMGAIGGGALGGGMGATLRYADAGENTQSAQQEKAAAEALRQQQYAAIDARKEAEAQQAAGMNPRPQRPMSLALQQDVFGGETPNGPAAAEVVDPAQRKEELTRQVLLLQDALEAQQDVLAKTSTPRESLAAAAKYAQIKDAHSKAETEVAGIKSVEDTLVKAYAAWSAAKAAGDVDATAKAAAKIVEMEDAGAQLPTPDTQESFAKKDWKMPGGFAAEQRRQDAKTAYTGDTDALKEQRVGAEPTNPMDLFMQENDALDASRVQGQQEQVADRSGKLSRVAAALQQRAVDRVEGAEQLEMPGMGQPLTSTIVRGEGNVTSEAALRTTFQQAKASGNRQLMRDTVEELRDLREQKKAGTAPGAGLDTAAIADAAPTDVAAHQDALISRGQTLAQLLMAKGPDDIAIARGRVLERLNADIENTSGTPLPQSARFRLAEAVNPVLDRLMRGPKTMQAAREAQQAMDSIRNRLGTAGVFSDMPGTAPRTPLETLQKALASVETRGPAADTLQRVRDVFGAAVEPSATQREALTQKQRETITRPYNAAALANTGRPAETVTPQRGVNAKSALAPTNAVKDVTDWLYGLRTGRNSPELQARVEEHLNALEQGKRSETEGGKTAVQKDMFPQKEQGVFPTPAAFNSYLGGEALHSLRTSIGAAGQTISRALKSLVPFQRKADALGSAVDKFAEQADWKGQNQTAARERLSRVVAESQQALAPLREAQVGAQKAVNRAARASLAIGHAMEFNIAKMQPQSEWAALTAAVSRAKETVQQEVNKRNWDAARKAQAEVIRLLEPYRKSKAALDASPEMITFMAKDILYQEQLQKAITDVEILQARHRMATERVQKASRIQQERIDDVTKDKETADAYAAKAVDKLGVARDEQRAAQKAADAEKARVLSPIEARRDAVTTKAPTETLSDRERASGEQRKAEQEALERADQGFGTPGERITFEAKRHAQAVVEAAGPRKAELEARIADPATGKAQRKKDITELNKLKSAEALLESQESREERMATMRKKQDTLKRTTIPEQRAIINAEGSTPKQVKKAKDRLRAAINEYQRLDSLMGMNEATRTPIEERDYQRLQAESYLREQREDTMAKEGTLQGDELLQLKAGRISQASNKERRAGDTRTGSEESKAGENKVGNTNRVQEERRVAERNRTITPDEMQAANADAEALHKAKEPLSPEAAKLELEGLKAKLESARERAEEAETLPGLSGTTRDRFMDRVKHLEEQVAAKEAALPKAEEAPKVQSAEDKALAQEFAGEGEVSNVVYRTTTTSGAGMQAAEVTRLANRIMASWTNAPKTVVVATEAALPQHIQAQAKRDGMTGKIPGLFDPDSKMVYLVASNLHTGNDVALTIAHEVAGHYGLRDMMGAAYTSTMNRLYAGNESIQQAADAKMKSDPNLSKEVAVEETLADMSETTPGKEGLSAVLSRVFYAVKMSLKKLFGITGVTDNEVRQIVANARRHVKRGEARGASAGGEAVYRAASSIKYANDELRSAGALARRVVAEQKSWSEKIKLNGLGLYLQHKLVDNYASLEKAAKHMDELAGTQMMMFARQYKQRQHMVSQVVQFGAPEIKHIARDDGRTEYMFSAKDDPNNFKAVVKDVTATAKMTGSPEASHQLFSLYTIAKRAETVGHDAMNYDVSKEDLDKALRSIRSVPGLEVAFAAAQKKLDAYNKGLLKFNVDAGEMTQAEYDRLTATGDYIPYYRVESDGTVGMWAGGSKIRSMGSLANHPELQQLVGGNSRILDFVTSTVQNTNMLVDMGMRNHTAKNAMIELQKLGVADIVPKDLSGKNIVHFKINGERVSARIKEDNNIGVPAEMLVEGLAGIPLQQTTLTKMLHAPSNFMRKAITLNPMYGVRQVFRDSIAAAISSGADIMPVIGALKQIGSPTGRQLERSGIVGSIGFSGSQGELSRALKDMGSGKATVNNLIAHLEAFSMEADALTRRAQYESYRKQGLSEMEATYQALESMNFSKHGASPSLHFATNSILFMNAQIQSINVLSKAIRGDMPANQRLRIQNKLLMRGAALAASSLLYAALMQDDETYKNATPEQRAGNWFIPNPSGGESIRVPIPFEIGYIFKALPEAVLNATYSKKGGEAAKTTFRTLALQTIPGGSTYGLPTALKPLIEAATNYSFYTGRSIENSHEQGLEPWARVRDDTTGAAEAVGRATNTSPVQWNKLIKEFTGGIGIAIAAAVGSVLPNPPRPERAEGELSTMPVFGSLFQPEDAGGIVRNVVDVMQNKVLPIKRTYDDLVNKGRLEQAEEYLAKGNNTKMYSMATLAEMHAKELQKIQKQIREVRNSDYSPVEKRDLIREYNGYIKELSTSVREEYDAQMAS